MSARSTPGVARTRPFPDASEVKRALLAQGEAVCRYMLHGGKRVGHEWVCGDLQGKPGRSLAVNLLTGVWRDFATGDTGSNLLELWRQVRGTDFATALVEASAFCGRTAPYPLGKDEATDKALQRGMWPPFEVGTREEFKAATNSRGIACEGIEQASARGLLRFTLWRGHRCWIVTDSRRLNAQARRLDGKPFIVNGKPIKALTLPGSRAGIPIGLVEAKGFPAVAVVEGGPDLLAVHGCCWAEGRNDVAGVAVLGAGNRPSVATWSPLAGKRVRVYCHRDEKGMEAGVAWGKAVLAVGVMKIDGFRFDALRKTDGSPVGDLNDLLALHPDDFEGRRDVWEILP